MEPILLESIEFEIDMDFLIAALHIEKNPRAIEEVAGLAGQAREIARPKAVYREAFINSRTDEQVVVDGVTLTSKILGINLAKTKRVFPFLLTCGMELEEWSRSFDNILTGFWIDSIKCLALGAASNAFLAHLEENYHPGPVSCMNPGSLNDWPIQEQKQLFELLGDSCGAIGVKLTESFMMMPVKSVSGIQFPSDEKFTNCQLCPRKDCPGRRSPYDEHLLQTKYSMDSICQHQQ